MLQVLKYIQATAPLTTSFPPPQAYMDNVVKALRKHDLTKTEVYQIINLLVGLPRPPPPANGDEMDVDADNGAADNTDADADIKDEPEDEDEGDEEQPSEEDAADANGRHILGLVLDSLDERFPGEEGERKIQQILRTLREYIKTDEASVNGVNGDNGDDQKHVAT
jgi:hypothetical protein